MYICVPNQSLHLMFKLRTITLLSSLISLSISLLLIPSEALAQKSIKDSTISVHLIMGHYDQQFPGGDLAKRFGGNSMVGPGYFYKTSGNWILGADCGFIFGNKVKESQNVLSNIETEDGNIVDMEGIYATYDFFERGFTVLGKVGKVISLNKPNANSGIMIGIGGGYMQHKIFIEHRDQTAPQITGDYAKGYDELKRGPAVNAFAGYLFLGNNRIVNFYLGAELTAGFTQYVHPYSFNSMKYNTGNFTDLLFSLKFGWLIPVYRRAPKEFYYY